MLINFFTDNNQQASSDPYRASLHRKNRYFAVMAVLGILMIAAAALNLTLKFAPNAGDILELYSGIGSALIAVSLVKLFLNRRLLRNETLYKEARLNSMDERNQALAGKAIQGAASTVLLGCYFAMLVGGFYSMTVFWCFWSVILSFVFAYCVYFGYYRTRM